jgi:hypothetical protein
MFSFISTVYCAAKVAKFPRLTKQFGKINEIGNTAKWPFLKKDMLWNVETNQMASKNVPFGANFQAPLSPK